MQERSPDSPAQTNRRGGEKTNQGNEPRQQHGRSKGTRGRASGAVGQGGRGTPSHRTRSVKEKPRMHKAAQGERTGSHGATKKAQRGRGRQPEESTHDATTRKRHKNKPCKDTRRRTNNKFSTAGRHKPRAERRQKAARPREAQGRSQEAQGAKLLQTLPAPRA